MLNSGFCSHSIRHGVSKSRLSDSDCDATGVGKRLLRRIRGDDAGAVSYSRRKIAWLARRRSCVGSRRRVLHHRSHGLKRVDCNCAPRCAACYGGAFDRGNPAAACHQLFCRHGCSAGRHCGVWMEPLKSDGMDNVDHLKRRHPCILSVGEVIQCPSVFHPFLRSGLATPLHRHRRPQPTDTGSRVAFVMDVEAAHGPVLGHLTFAAPSA